MKEFFTVVLGSSAVFGLIISFLLIGPILFIWAINSLAEACGSEFYIEHELWNYLVAFILLLLVRGGLINNSK